MSGSLSVEEIAAVLHEADGPHARLASLLRQLADMVEIDLPDMSDRPQWQIDLLVESARTKLIGAVEPWRATPDSERTDG